MSTKHHRVTTAAAVVLVALALAVLLTACGDPYSGTWTADFQGEKVTFKIEKSGDKWVITDPSNASSEKIEGTEENGKLAVKNPDDPSQTMTFERKGDDLIMALGGVSITFKKQ